MTTSGPQANPRQVLVFVVAAGVVGLVALHGCSGSGTASKAKPDGCVFVDEASQSMVDLSNGLDAKTLTAADMAGLLKHISDKLGEAATLSTGQMLADAQAGADDAGRVRVAVLAEGGSVASVSADSGDLVDKLHALEADCK